MRASSWMPGTALVIGVRFGGLGEITSRSVCGVNAKGGSPGKESLAGVVAGLLVVRSALSMQLVSVSWRPSAAKSPPHPLAATVGVLRMTTATTVRRTTPQRILCSFPRDARSCQPSDDRRSYRNFDSQPIVGRLWHLPNAIGGGSHAGAL